MRPSIFYAILFIAMSFSLFPPPAEGQNTFGASSLIFDESTGIMHGYATSEPDYNVQGYYDTMLVSCLVEENPERYLDCFTQKHPGRVEVGLQGEASADTQYRIESLHEVEAIVHEYFYPDPEYGEPVLRYNDYYNYESLPGAQYFLSYTFYGPGPPIWLGSASRRVEQGRTYDRKKTGVPDHLQVWFDYYETNCGGRARKRLLYLKVVDFEGKGVGKVSLKEDTGGQITDSCTAQRVITRDSCAEFVDKESRFTDIIGTGCPAEGVTACGFDIKPVKWQWCPKTGSPVTIAQLDYEVRPNEIKVNGRTGEYGPGTKFFRDGTMQIR